MGAYLFNATDVEFTQNRNKTADIKNKLMVTKGENWWRDKLGVWY